MAIAIVLLLILVASVIFHFVGPWDLPPLASNWGDIDLTIGITVLVTGLVFLAVMIFTIIAIIKFRYRPDRTADYEPENKKLELWLTGLSALGIIAMLAPGLYVYSEVVSVPDDALPVEAMAKQWGWAFRLPGDDGVLGKSDVRRVSADNPFGLDPLDPASQDDRLIQTPTLHLALNRPVQAQLRSLDVLHNFYVPQFRTKMDAVPGIVSSFWFTPTVEGEFEILCAEYCGVGHFNMRGKVVVQPEAEYALWLAQQPTFAEAQLALAQTTLSPLAREGEKLATEQGCMGCHGFAASPLGPSWSGIYGRAEVMSDGTELTVDDAYLIESIREPAAKLVQGYANVMPPYDLSDQQIAALIAYMKEKGGAPGEVEAAPAAPPVSGAVDAQPDQSLTGVDLAQAKGCLACHSVDGQKLVGPTWVGLAGSERTLLDGTTVIADEDYLRRAIIDPNAEVVEGYPPVMPVVSLTEAEILDLIQTIESLKQ
ncbi:cytochrome c oxidase subunit II [Ferrimonas balearica]|uniref:cytochrome c oxidase subunit II n=1 Tax=Ferrimonas balearica TaxID=44012 RepID=UPI001C99DD25|nr:cytochrome c oxidase subunit II [Ferrimonas balearica]MBY5920256.1 cytochrome c oxidase subunit II [Ferrimonas balearica]MBY5997059.1 cytochrome c oxidase subunit II [Ferrimonas balearica]